MKRTRTGMPAGLGAAVRRVHDAARGRTVAVAESCTGGLLGAWLTSRGGSSAWFLGGVIAYANGVKMRLLGVGEEALRRHGAVSAPVARAMAEGVRRTLGADVGVSITGVAGPAGGTARKPVGLVYIGVATAAGVRTRRRVLSGNRAKVRSSAARAALDELAGALEAKS